MEQQEAKRRPKLHSVCWIVMCISATTFLNIPSSPRDWLVIEMAPPLETPQTLFLENESFDAVWGRHIPTFPAHPTDVTQIYDEVDSEDYEGTMEKTETDCRPPHYKSHSTCNDVHSMDLTQDLLPSNKTSILSTKGFWRYAWELEENNTTLVFKTFRLTHAFEEAFYGHQQVDALVMEQFTSSPYILDMYSNCGLSVLTDFAGTQLSSVVNKLKPPKRLKLARQVAKGVATLHNGGVIHNDLNPSNVAYSERKKTPVLFDFNIAILGKQCPFEAKFPNPQWRAPEEQAMKNALTEKVDIYALGNILFRFAVGSQPWDPIRSAEQTRSIAQRKLINGTMPPFPLPPKNDTATQALLNIMVQCYAFAPQKRPSASRVVATLNAAIHNLANQTTSHHRHHTTRKHHNHTSKV